MKKKIFFSLLMLLVLGSCNNNEELGWLPTIEYNFSADGGSATFFDIPTGIVYFSATDSNGKHHSDGYEICESEIPIVIIEMRDHYLRYVKKAKGSWFEIHHPHRHSPMVVTVQPNLSGRKRWINIRIAAAGTASFRITQSAE